MDTAPTGAEVPVVPEPPVVPETPVVPEPPVDPVPTATPKKLSKKKQAEKTDDNITFAPVTASGMAAFFATMRRQSTVSSFSESQAGTPQHVAVAARTAPAVSTSMIPAASPAVPSQVVAPTPTIPTPAPVVVEVPSSQTQPVVQAVFDESGKVRRMSALGITSEMENVELERVMKMENGSM